jgi:hypothetical protein
MTADYEAKDGLFTDMPESDIPARLDAIRQRLSMVSPYGPELPVTGQPNLDWGYRGKTVAHKAPAGYLAIVGGRYEGMGESQSIAMVDEPGDASLIICAPRDLQWCVSTIERLLDLLT